MAKRAGVVRPAPSETAFPVEMIGEPFDNPALDLYRESGDLEALRDSSFSDWSWIVYRLATPEEVTRARLRSPRVWQVRTWCTRVPG